MHVIDSVRIDYSQNPTEVFIREYNLRVFDIKRLTIEVKSSDTLAVNLFYIDCSSYFIGQIINDTIIHIPQGLNPSFNLIVRTYKDTNTHSYSYCPERDFYTLTDSVFISKGDSIFTTLSNNDFSIKDLDIDIYPNPVSTQLFVEYPKSINTLNYSIYNTQGNKLLNGKLEKSIDVSMLKNGIYIIRFERQNGVVTKKFIVK